MEINGKNVLVSTFQWYTKYSEALILKHYICGKSVSVDSDYAKLVYKNLEVWRGRFMFNARHM